MVADLDPVASQCCEVIEEPGETVCGLSGGGGAGGCLALRGGGAFRGCDGVDLVGRSSSV